MLIEWPRMVVFELVQWRLIARDSTVLLRWLRMLERWVLAQK